MAQAFPPRYLPTLTEVVKPDTPGAYSKVLPPADRAMPAANVGRLSAVAPDRHALAQQLIKSVKPQLEAELRNIAQELFEAQFSALLPSLHLQIEEAVREAIEQALPDPRD